MRKLLKSLSTLTAFLALTLGVGYSLTQSNDMVGAKAATTVSVGNDFEDVSGNFDTNFRYDSYQGGGTTSPTVTDGDIRLYQKSNGGDGGYITVTSRVADYKMTSFTISASMAGPFSVYSISAGSVDTPDPSGWISAATSPTWVGTALPKTYTYNNPSGFTHFKVVCNGTSKTTRLYVDFISITYDYFGGPAIPVTGISLSNASATLFEQGEVQITASIEPANAGNKNVIWSTNNQNVVTVSSDGLITAISEGTAIVTATTEDGAFTAQCEITVNALILNSISIKTPADKTTFKLGEVFSWDGLIINANYNSGIVQKNTGFIVTGIDTTVLGEQEAIVSFEGKSITYTVWVVEDPLVLESSAFGGEESDWIVNGSFETYFGHKYGIKSSLSIKNNSSFNALKARPVGTEISVEVIAASVEEPGNLITVYGLNHEGNRITGIESSQLMTYGNYSGSLSNARNDAFANPTQIVLPVSFTDKVESIEISFSSSPSALLFEVNVFASIANIEDQVSAFTGLVNDGLGNFANGKCEEVYNYLIDEFNLLDEEAQQEFGVSNETNILSARERINYLQAWVNTNSSLGLTRFHEGSTTENQVFAVITIGVLALSALIGYYFINKKKQYN